MLFIPKIPKKTRRRIAYIAAAAVLLGLPALAIGDEGFVLQSVVPVNGGQLLSFDISYVDPSIHSYFLADRSNSAIDVIDTHSKNSSQIGAGDFAGAAASSDTSGPNGVLTVHQGGDHDGDRDRDDRGRVQVWAGDAPHLTCTERKADCSSTVKVYSYPAGNLLHDISTGGLKRADEGCWDPDDRLALFANDAETTTSGAPAPFITFISTDYYEVVGKITFDGGSGPKHGPLATNGIEQCQYDAREHAFYLNLPEVNGNGADTADGAVVVINPHSLRIVRIFDIPVAKCAGPQGMAIGPAPQILLGCNAKGPPTAGTGTNEAGTGAQNAAIMNEDSGELTVLANQGGNDEVWFNPGDGHYFLAESSSINNGMAGNCTVSTTTGAVSCTPPTPQLGIVDSRSASADRNIATGASAHSVAADPEANQAYVPIKGGTATICGQFAGETSKTDPDNAQGCVAIYGPSGPDDRYVYRGH